jgi:diguanylate cyclase (GGDEF)-like protein
MPNRMSVRRSVSLGKSLRTLVLFSVLPTVLICTWLAYSNYRLQRATVEQQTVMLARATLASLERDLAARGGGLKVLASTAELARGDLKAFHRHATEALATDKALNYVLTDAEGLQILNTLFPYGGSLPKTGTPVELRQVFAKRQSVLSDLFVGVTTRVHVLALGVPVQIDGYVRYSLNMGLTPEHINRVIDTQNIPDGWLVAVLDSSQVIVGRSRDAGRFVGQTAGPRLQKALGERAEGFLESVTKDNMSAFTGYSTSPRWGWTVIASAPQRSLYGDLIAQLGQVLVALLLALVVGFALARRAGAKVLSSVQQLNNTALALSRGEEVQPLTLELREAEAVGTAMLQAAEAMRKVKFYAQHDALTELPNRLLFDELAQRTLLSARRHRRAFALLALDLDGFKKINDSLGHAVGDEVLKTVAQRITYTIRASDVAARIGGDEFLVLLADVDHAEAMQTADRLVVAIAQPYYGVNVPLGVSIGLAEYPLHGADLKTLLLGADEAMYAAKIAGKGQTCSAKAPAALA